MAIPTELNSPATRKWVVILRRFAYLVESRPNMVLPVWIIAYFAVLWPAAHRPLWFDELCTYYVATSPTLAHLIGSIRFIDLNPPISYLFVRSSIALFGDSPFVTRLPCMLGFLGASLIAYKVVVRRLGGGVGLAALGIFWSFHLTAYAVEARSYGLLLLFFSIAMYCWLNAVESDRWTNAHTGMAAAIAAMLLTHCYSPVLAAALGAGELVRTVVVRRIDKRVWLALLAPLALIVTYIPLVQHAHVILFPDAFRATAMTAPKFYLAILAPVLPALGLMLLIWLGGKGPQVHPRDFLRPHEIAFAAAAFFTPLAIMSFSVLSGAPFWPRYGIGAALGGALILAALFAIATRRRANVAVGACGLILIFFCVSKAGTGSLVEEYENTSTIYRDICPELPFVTASGLTFLEMDHREAPEFIHRLYYLTDQESAVRTHTTIFEVFPLMRQWFPIRANLLPYLEFTTLHRQFLVLGTRGFPEDWLLEKLEQDGAQIRLLQNLKTGYRDRELYEVTIEGPFSGESSPSPSHQ